ncbi:Dos2-interacting transcription regulator of RNA-Pol-II-domain-containing protein [Parachaetomium inaequale]|uniref:MMS19 nucleotide excision repair protein n=1 Tax=Parachaetomium inaequale TaxID=2588326 RepID=A0AAN6PFN8_9PEZI|nr:Dos2-interacting transcription regulator of RNA-Pol-II-domain-containing protein [Parachaetomium inaequale]
MAQFKQWALEYVLSDDEPAQLEITKKAAQEIESSRASSTVVGNWAASVQQWMTPASAEDDHMDDADGDEGGSGDIIARAKVLRLIGFFGAMFSYDHKAGITASAKALRQLRSTKSFKPNMGAKILDDVCKIKEDFRLQTAVTRLEIYELFLGLIQDPAVSSELKHKYGSSCGFVVDLLQVCQSERDPRNLMIWFKILALLVSDYDPSPEVAEEIFKVFSAYFPISLRSSATPIGITAEDLKEAVRSCFSAHQRVANLAFPFLLQKLDQGDAVTLDILKTIKACIEQYENPQANIVPHIETIWNSLKYEVRNGEVKETIDATLDVLRTIARKLDGTAAYKLDVSLLQGYVDLVSRDCRDDLANPTYTKQAGLLLMTVISANIRAYVLYNAGFIDTIRQNLRQPKSPSHTRDLLLLLNSLLKTRMELFRDRRKGHPDDVESLRTESRSHLDTLFHDVYLPVWTDKTKEPVSEERDVLKQVIQGLALLVSQQVLQSDGTPVLLCSGSVCSEICSFLSLTVTKGLSLSSNDNDTEDTALEDEAVLALRTIVMNYTGGYAELAGRVKAEIKKRDWTHPSEYSLGALKDLLSRFTFIGCSEAPTNIATDTPKQFSPLQHFITLTASLLEVFPLSSEAESIRLDESASANALVISSLHASVIWFRDACEAKYGKEALTSTFSGNQHWLDEFRQLPDDWLLQVQRGDGDSSAALPLLKEDGPEVYHQFLKLDLFIVRYLYRSATVGPRGPWDERALVQLSQMAALVVRSLDEELQVSCNLADEAFNFFRDADKPSPSSSELLTGLLTLGILQGLRPGALTGLYNPGGQAPRFLCGTPDFGDSPSRESDIRAAIGAILANKYKEGPSTPEPLVMKQTLDHWGTWLKEATTSSPPDASTFQAHTKIALNVIAGAAARQDKHVLALIPTLHQAASSPHPNGEILARSLGLIVKQNDLLTPENHAVVKRFHKQWTYSHLAKPLLQPAQPGRPADPLTTTRYRIAVLSVISNCPFSVYQDDLPLLIRLLVTALAGSSRAELADDEETGWSQTAAALGVLVEILTHESGALTGYLREVIGGVTRVYQECSPQTLRKKNEGVGTQWGAARTALCRRLALQVLGGIPSRFEERHVRAYALPTQRMLAAACGDPVRRVREVARVARGSWARVV